VKHRPGKIIFTLFLALCIAISFLWLRSQSHHDAIYFANAGGSSFSLGSRIDGFRVWRISPWPTDEHIAFHTYARGGNPLLLRLNITSADSWRWLGVEDQYGIAVVPLNNDTGRPWRAYRDDRLDLRAFHDSPVMHFSCLTVPHSHVLLLAALIPAALLIVRVDPQWRIRRWMLYMIAAASLALSIGSAFFTLKSDGKKQKIDFFHDGTLWNAIFDGDTLTVENTTERNLERRLEQDARNNLKAINRRDDFLSTEIARKLANHPTSERRRAMEQEDQRLQTLMRQQEARIFSPLQTPSPESHSFSLLIPLFLGLILPVGLLARFSAQRNRRPAPKPKANLKRGALCPDCGIDLAGWPGKCPQCGSNAAREKRLGIAKAKE
jgi:hypothetical protein